MGTLIWDIAQSLKDVGFELNSFLYDGKVKDKQLRDHTKEELIAELEWIRKDCFERYNEISDSLGWNE